MKMIEEVVPDEGEATAAELGSIFFGRFAFSSTKK
jgi:hypothetical protein